MDLLELIIVLKTTIRCLELFNRKKLWIFAPACDNGRSIAQSFHSWTQTTIIRVDCRVEPKPKCGKASLFWDTLGVIGDEISENGPIWRATCHKTMKTLQNRMSLASNYLLLSPWYFRNLIPTYFLLLSDFKRILIGKYLTTMRLRPILNQNTNHTPKMVSKNCKIALIGPMLDKLK